MDGGIKFDVSADTAKFDADMARVGNVATRASDKVKQAFSGLGGLLAGGAIIGGLKTVMDDFDKVAKVATRFGASAEDIQRVSVAADLAGVSIDTVARVLTKMSVAASDATSGNKAMAESFAKAGLNAEQFKNAGLDQQLVMLSEAFNKARGSADATNQIIELIGTRAASQMIPLIDNTAALRSEMEGVSVASDDVVRKIEAANDRMTRVFNDIKVGFAGLIGFITDTSERVGSLFGGAGFKTIAELDEIEARATAISQLTREGLFTLDAVKNAELIADRTKQILEQTQGTNKQLEIAEDTTTDILDIETRKTDELARQAEQLQRQEERRQNSIRSMEAEIRLIEAQISGNKELEESLRRQADFDFAFAKTGSTETAANFEAVKSAERRARQQGGGAPSATSAGPSFDGSSILNDPTFRERVAAMRGDFRAREADERAAALRDRRAFGSSVRAEDRAQRARDRAMANARMRDRLESEFGTTNTGEAFRDFRNQFGMDSADLIKKGLEDLGEDFDKTRDLQSNFDRLAREQSKTPEERAREAAAARDKHGAKGGAGAEGPNSLQRLVSSIKSLCQSIDGKLPQHAMS